MFTYIENEDKFNTNNINILRELVGFIVDNKNSFVNKIHLSYKLIKFYKNNGEDEIIRKFIENIFVEILEKKYQGNTEKFLEDMKKSVFLPPNIKEMYEEDLEEAIDTYKMKKVFKKNEEKLKEFLSNV
jgi:hypothetical protein